ncbi:CYTH domain-containing protein [Pseudaeromonas sp. ZJS20]|uniref:CYTH and CHAD domain-containing protein n=1 Tax=Pseudaeromonas aegiceratis TaxID=3153928 RepID=UPI00390C62FC
METEVELKFLASDTLVSQLPACLAQFQLLEQAQMDLANTYFDTPDQRLRALDCGLRIRRRDESRQQTIKTAGQVVGGLYQRPEYNLAIQQDWPELAAFPAEIWPAGTDVAGLQAALKPLFCTNFHRQTWLVAMPDGSRVEVALDQGQIVAGEQQEPIGEVELELISGQVTALFELAAKLVQLGGLRLGGQSKAQRGYLLAGMAAESPIQRMGFAPVSDTMTVGQGLFCVLQYALAHWQYHEQLFFDHPCVEALVQLRNGVNLVRQAQLIFADIYLPLGPRPWQDELAWLEGELAWLDEAQALQRLTAERAHYLRALRCHDRLLTVLEQRQAGLPDSQGLRNLLQSPRYTSLLLAITRWVYLEERQLEKPDPQRDAPLLGFAAEQLAISWQELHEPEMCLPALDYDGYLSLVGKLRRNLLVGVSFANLYDEESRQGFRLPWQGLLRRMEELEHFEVLDRLAPELATAQRLELEEWLTARISPRLLELDQARLQAQQMLPYWEEPAA